MSFAGHESFHVREGWLSKALKLVIHHPEVFLKEYPEDKIGVGRNMYKSIRYWLIATGLVEGKLVRKGANQGLVPTWLGIAISEADPYFLSQTTWWVLHVNLVNNPAKSVVWDWFFNNWKLKSFEKSRCQNSFSEFVEINQKKKPRQATLEKDLSVLINSYAIKIQEATGDPEDTSDSPFQDLGLLKYQKNSNSYLLNTGNKKIPQALIGYSLWSSKYFSAGNEHDQFQIEDMPVEKCISLRGGLGACFVMNAEQLFQVIQETGEALIRIEGLAGNRAVRVSQITGPEWIQEAYEAEKGYISHA